jgi:hypothetical protein
MDPQATYQQLERLIHPAVVGYALRCALRVWGRMPQELRSRGILDQNQYHIRTIISALRITWDYVNGIAIDADDLRRAEEDTRATCRSLNELTILKLQKKANCIDLPPDKVLQKVPLSQEVQAGLKSLLAAVRAASYAAQSLAQYGDHGVASLALDAATWSIAAETKARAAAVRDLEHFAAEWSITPPKEKDDMPVLPKSDKPMLPEDWPLYAHSIPRWFKDAMRNGWVFPF